MNETIKGLLKPTMWKVESGIYIPQHIIKVSAADVAIATYVTHKKIRGNQYTKKDLIRDLSSLSIEDCLIIISRILTVLENDGYFSPKAQRALVSELFSRDVRDRVLSYVDNGGNG